MTVQDAVDGFRDEGWNFVRFTDTKDYNGFLRTVASLGPEDFMVDIHIKELLLFPPNTQFYRHEAYKNGSISLQDKVRCPLGIPGSQTQSADYEIINSSNSKKLFKRLK